MVSWKDQVREAIRLRGTQKQLAELMGCSQAKVSWLLVTADQISAEDALAIHRATDGRVPASSMRPDLWPTEQHLPIEPAPARAAS